MRSDNLLVRSNNPSEGQAVPPVASEMRSIVLEAAWPAEPGESVKAAILRSSRRLQLGYARARAYWYEQVRLVPAEEADRLRRIQQGMLAERLARIDAEAALIRARLGDRA